jgi:hypothetical protein
MKRNPTNGDLLAIEGIDHQYLVIDSYGVQVDAEHSCPFNAVQVKNTAGRYDVSSRVTSFEHFQLSKLTLIAKCKFTEKTTYTITKVTDV